MSQRNPITRIEVDCLILKDGLEFDVTIGRDTTEWTYFGYPVRFRKGMISPSSLRRAQRAQLALMERER